MSRHRRLAAVALPAFALVAAGCGGNGDGTDAASSDDSITIYSGRDEELIQPLIDKMEDETGLKVEVRYGKTAEMAAQLLEEGERTEADLFIAQDAGALGALGEEGMLTDLPDDVLDLVPAEFNADNGQWVGISGRSRVIAYDPRQVDTPPDSVMDLTDDEWKGKVGIAPSNASFQSFVTGLRIIEGDDAAQQWLDDMAGNGVQSYEKNGLMLDALDAGEIAISLNNHYYWYERVKELGEDAVESELHYLPGGDAGALINVAGAGILSSSDSPEQAQKALEYLLSEDAQAYFTTETSEYPLAEGVEPGENLPPLDDLEQPDIDLSDLHTLDETLKMIEESGLV
nr:iron ABC transporter substrate-binding protein [Nocardiopsis mwathae]